MDKLEKGCNGCDHVSGDYGWCLKACDRKGYGTEDLYMPTAAAAVSSIKLQRKCTTKKGFPIDTEAQLNRIAAELANLVAEKQRAYGDSVGRSEKIMAILYPDGISVEQYKDALPLIRVLDKLSRIATDRDALGENPWKDISGYTLLRLLRDSRESS